MRLKLIFDEVIVEQAQKLVIFMMNWTDADLVML